MKREIEDIKAVNRRIIATLVRLEGKVDDLGERMATKDDLAALRSDIAGRFDDFAGLVKDARFKLGSHAKQLTEHDERLKKLETRRS